MKKKISYSNMFKAEVVLAYLNGEATAYQVGKIYGVDTKTVKNWVASSPSQPELSANIVKRLVETKALTGNK